MKRDALVGRLLTERHGEECDDLFGMRREAASRIQDLEQVLEGRGIGSESSVSEELRGCAEIASKNGWTEWASHLIAKADALDECLTKMVE